MKNLTPKVVLITGASSGIGFDAAERLLKHGCIVYAAARRVERMAQLQQQGAHLLAMDVTDEESMRQGMDKIASKEGRLDVLVNNAGYGSFGPVEQVPIEEARRQMEVNVFGLARLSQLALPLMRKAGGGRIINVASVAGHITEPHGAWYHATKFAVVALSECMRMEVHDQDIKIILIEPGAIASEWCDIAMDHLEATTLGTPYEASARHHSQSFRWSYRHYASPAKVIGRAIEHAATSRCPRRRYRRGLGSTLLPFLHTLLPSCWYETIARKALCKKK